MEQTRSNSGKDYCQNNLKSACKLSDRASILVCQRFFLDNNFWHSSLTSAIESILDYANDLKIDIREVSTKKP